ncbi:hypothetical protein NLX83_04325 [Allokutzneria sp. A3M-2-11 16]|uniref:hypothetical protein n=1 Tax=Allokutzneria sp. A3M-2-11 16 TaxID=2962043 RepID=UPI0020B8B533|nr:hypothetical protein [Allokutzneria sp. A3M-2-11 16]MCP3798480.1 hypothetical protein [Allokutzneria sp. A3M-2-11 16]
MSKGKRPTAKSVPQGARSARTREAAGIPDRLTPRREFTPSEPQNKVVVLFSRIDLDGPWCLTKINQGAHRALLKRVKGFESMTVQEIFARGDGTGKDYALPDLPSKAALERLRELEYDDRDQISRLRIDGPGRLYGFRERERFYVLWWDPEHEIWPSKKKHT